MAALVGEDVGETFVAQSIQFVQGADLMGIVRHFSGSDERVVGVNEAWRGVGVVGVIAVGLDIVGGAGEWSRSSIGKGSVGDAVRMGRCGTVDGCDAANAEAFFMDRAPLPANVGCGTAAVRTCCLSGS